MGAPRLQRASRLQRESRLQGASQLQGPRAFLSFVARSTAAARACRAALLAELRRRGAAVRSAPRRGSEAPTSLVSFGNLASWRLC